VGKEFFFYLFFILITLCTRVLEVKKNEFYSFKGNKGANLCTLKIGNRTMCLINAHLSAHENNRKTRANVILNFISIDLETCFGKYVFHFLKEYKTIIKRKVDLKYETETIDQQEYV
jgi:hypothetical protein